MILAIDCGSTNHKVALFDQSLVRRAEGSTSVAYLGTNAKRVEFDPEKFWADTVILIKQACAAAGIKSSAIRTVALTSQAQTFTILDSNGRPLMPFVSWMDKRAINESFELDRLLGKSFHQHCGFPSPIPQLQLPKLLWLQRQRPPRIPADALIVSLPGFLAWRLARAHASDTNSAAMTGMYSCAENGWWLAPLEICRIHREQMGNLVSLGEALSTERPCPDLGFPRGLRLVFGGNDQTAGAYANGRGRLVLTLGTALAAYRHAGAAARPHHPRSCWGPHPGGGFYELATRDEGGAALDWAIEELLHGDRETFMNLASSARPATGLFYPERMGTGGAWTGPRDLATRARAALEGICFAARELIELDLDHTAAADEIVVSGGGSRNSLWVGILANVLNRPLCVGVGDALLGAAMIACPENESAGRDRTLVVRPNPQTAARYEQAYCKWRERKACPALEGGAADRSRLTPSPDS